MDIPLPELDSRIGEATMKLADAEARIKQLESEEEERRKEAINANQELARLKQLQHYATTEQKLRQTQSRIMQLESNRQQAEMEATQAAMELDTLRSSLYELPPSRPERQGNVKLNKLQAEAYIERHDVDALMEDILASLLEFMPTYPYPFLMNLLKKKSGISNDEQEEAAQKRIAGLQSALDAGHAEIEQLNEELQKSNEAHNETRGLLDSTQKELQESVKELTAVTEQDGKIIRKLENDVSSLQAEIDQEKNHVINLEASLRSSQTDLQSARDALSQAKKDSARTSQVAESTEISRLQQQLENLQLQAKRDAKELKAKNQEIRDMQATDGDASAQLEGQVMKLKKMLMDEKAKVRDLAAQLENKEFESSEKHAELQALQKELNSSKKKLVTMKESHEQKIQEAEAKAAAYHEEEDVSETFKAADIAYNFSVRTGDVKWAGTDARVTAQLIGERGQTDKFKLAKSKGHKDKFERGRKDLFTVYARDIGRLQKLVIGHDGHGLGDGWYLDYVDVDVPALGKRYKFTADRWLAKDKADGKLEITVVAEEGDLQQYKPKAAYVLKTFTSDKSGASLDNATVYAVVYGENGKSEEVKLYNGEKTFDKRGKVDEFNIEIDDVGDVTKIRVWHDNKGVLGASWHLKSIELTDLKDDVLYKFAADRWLSKSHGDKTIVAELPVTSIVKDGQETSTGQNTMVYEVHVHTGTVSGAGTDANVFMILFGENGDTGERPLKRSKNHKLDKFRKGQEDIFDIEGADLGALTRLKIWHDNKDLIGADWYLDSVTVINTKDDTSTEFPCDSWLSKSRGDKQLVRELRPKGDEPEELQVVKAVGTDYNLTVYTSDIREAGTDARVFVEIHGEEGDSGKVQLKKSSTNRDKFQRGQVDKFVINAIDVGEPKALTIGHDNHREGLLTNPSWHLDRVEIEIPTLGKTVTFPANRWLAKGKDDGQLQVRLVPGASGATEAVSTFEKKEPWEVIVYTSDIKSAGTDADVHMVVYGKKEDGSEGMDELSFEGKATDDSFERGSEDRFSFEVAEIGDPYKIRIGHNNKKLFADWHVQKVALINPQTKSRYEFLCDFWLSKKAGLEHEVLLSKKIGLSEDGKTTIEKEKVIDLSMATYTLHLKTGTVKHAGTDANVTVTLFGKNGDSGERKLKDSQNRDKFESGQTDTFELTDIVDLGTLTRIKLECDTHRGMHLLNPKWYLESISVEGPFKGSPVSVDVNTWFGKKDGLVHEFAFPKKSTSRSRSRSSSQPRSTSKPRRSIAGPSPSAARRSGARVSSPASSSRGASPKARAGVSTPGSTKKKAPSASSKLGPRVNRSYTIKVKTGSKSNSSTDARITLDITGSRGSSGGLKLDKSKTNKDKFENGKTDEFEFDMLDLGDLKSIKLVSDNHRGRHMMHPEWFVESVSISSGNLGPWEFKCNAWLSKKEGLSKAFTVSSAPKPQRSSARPMDDDEDDSDDGLLQTSGNTDAYRSGPNEAD